ncbi:hypothetical protein Tsubulata_009238 [Turnera subulata]|uniref:CCHC-type domain-containing protein n=1 Tax=Turnera subulata TaxID=218843 RepID=A0A9Q0F1B6_9ROSI|nr:hypothetical protein Tsubulata_009238 [Turnera subulata]
MTTGDHPSPMDEGGEDAAAIVQGKISDMPGNRFEGDRPVRERSRSRERVPPSLPNHRADHSQNTQEIVANSSPNLDKKMETLGATDTSTITDQSKEGLADPPTPPSDVDMETPRMSYREKLTMGSDDHHGNEQWEEDDESEYEDGDIVVYDEPGGTVVELSETFKSRLAKLWRLAVIVKLLGRPIGYRVLKDKIESMWRPKGAYKIVDLANNFYIVRFKTEGDFHHALFVGPWTILNHVLCVQPWTTDFRASKGTIDTAIVWVQFPDIPPNWYHSKILKTLGDLVGRTIKVDIQTSTSTLGKFSKVAVAIDLTKPVKGRLRLEGELIQVKYEGLSNVCFSCGRVSHTSTACPSMRQQAASLGADHQPPPAMATSNLE